MIYYKTDNEKGEGQGAVGHTHLIDKPVYSYFEHVIATFSDNSMPVSSRNHGNMSTSIRYLLKQNKFTK